MHSRKHTVGRNILRIFEIAIFFAVSVVGYSLMLKASASQAKSKSRSHTPDLQRSLEPDNRFRELNHLASKLIPSERKILSDRQTGILHTVCLFPVPPVGTHHPHAIVTADSGLSPYFRHSDRTPRPCNLLQLNPVLLV
jgi:hypothetical protein